MEILSRIKFKNLFLFVGFIFPLFTHAAQSITIQGRLLNSAGSAITSSAVSFTLQVRSPGAEDCLLYQESQTLNLSTTQGAFAITLGSGTRAAATVDGGNSLNSVFSNSSPLSLTSAVSPCANADTSFTPSASDTRKIAIAFNDGTGPDSLPSLSLSWIPQAMYAQDSGKLGNTNAAQFLRVATGTTPSVMSGADYTTLLSLIAGTPVGGYLTSLNGLSSTSQTFANGSTGTAPAFVSATSTHTLNIPLASGAGVTSGTISKTDYDLFSGKLTSPLTTKGDLLSRDSTTHVRLPVGTDGYVLKANSATASGLEWGSASINAGSISGVVAIANGGTNSSTALTNGKVMISSAGSIVEGVSSNTAKSNNTFVVRDGSGNIAGALGSFDQLALNGAVSGAVNIYAPSTFTSWNMTLPSDDGTSGQFLQTNGSGVTSWVSAVTNGSSVLAADGSAANPAYAFSSGGSADNGMFLAAADTLGFSSAGAERLRIDSVGNVGIGTTLPTAALHLKAGTTAVGGAPLKFTSGAINTTPEIGALEFLTDTLYFTITSGADRKQIVLSESSLSQDRVPFVNNGRLTNDSDLTFLTDTLTATKLVSPTSVATPSIITASGALGITPAGGSNLNVNLSTTGDFAVNTNQLYVDTSAGFVGIGTTTPTNPLHVSTNNSTTPPVIIENLNATGASSIQFNNSASTLKGSIGFSNASNLMQLGTTSTQDLRFLTNSLERVRIDSSGTVGIGTTSPGSTLDVVSNLVSASGTDLGVRIRPTVNSSGTAGYTALLVNATETAVGSGAKNLLDLQNGGVSNFRVTSAGVVTVGTSVSLNGGATTLGLNGLTVSAGNTTGTGVSVGGASWTSGNLLSGSTASNAFTGNIFRGVYSGTGSGTAANLSITNASASGTVLVVSNSGTGHAATFAGGNVGIGTTTPQSTLQINGYVQLALTSGAPAGTDCDAATEYGRMRVDATAGVSRLYICTADGWIFK